jgi:hypothetical protein
MSQSEFRRKIGEIVAYDPLPFVERASPLFHSQAPVGSYWGGWVQPSGCLRVARSSDIDRWDHTPIHKYLSLVKRYNTASFIHFQMG